MLRAVTILLSGAFVTTSFLFAVANDADTSFALAVFGLLGTVGMMIHPRLGLGLNAVAFAFALLASFNVEWGFLFEAAVYGLFVFMAWRVVQARIARREERRLAAERAERADRYIRQQLGED